VQDYEESNPATHKGLNLHTMSMAALYAHFGLDAQTVDFIGHSLALHSRDTYLDQPAAATVAKVKLYHDSLTRYDGLTSPYIYPRYGLGELPQVCMQRSPPLCPPTHPLHHTHHAAVSFPPRLLLKAAAAAATTTLPRLPASCVAGLCAAECCVRWHLHAAQGGRGCRV
jgi:GDP dissociation inhibitor